MYATLKNIIISILISLIIGSCKKSPGLTAKDNTESTQNELIGKWIYKGYKDLFSKTIYMEPYDIINKPCSDSSTYFNELNIDTLVLKEDHTFKVISVSSKIYTQIGNWILTDTTLLFENIAFVSGKDTTKDNSYPLMYYFLRQTNNVYLSLTTPYIFTYNDCFNKGSEYKIEFLYNKAN